MFTESKRKISVRPINNSCESVTCFLPDFVYPIFTAVLQDYTCVVCVQVWFTWRTWCVSFGRRRRWPRWQTQCLSASTRQTRCLFVNTSLRLSLVLQSLSGAVMFCLCGILADYICVLFMFISVLPGAPFQVAVYDGQHNLVLKFMPFCSSFTF